jgi:pyridoxal phosphate enzyme (YggS family)
MSSIAQRLELVRERIRKAADAAGRLPTNIHLLAVCKTVPAALIREAYVAGQHAFGENYVQEASEKIIALADLRQNLEWHFIGPLQSNKTKEVATLFDWVHSIDRLKIAQRLSVQRLNESQLRPLQVCVQVNLSGETTKGGVAPHEVAELCDLVAQLPAICLRGLMTIPAPSANPAIQALACAQLRQCFTELATTRLGNLAYAHFDTLSMGMSDDLEAAIAEGSTLVRIGTAIFGQRN